MSLDSTNQTTNKYKDLLTDLTYSSMSIASMLAPIYMTDHVKFHMFKIAIEVASKFSTILDLAFLHNWDLTTLQAHFV